MFFRRKKKILENLESSFGRVKTEGFNFDLIKRYYQHKEDKDAFQVLSDQTCDDLDFDLFFSFADRTSSKIGQQYLYDRMRTIESSPEAIELQEKAIKQLLDKPEERLKIQYQLQQLNHDQAYYIVDLFQQELDEKPKWYFLIPLLSFTSFLSLILSFFNSNFLILLMSVFSINLFIHYALKRKTNLFINSIPPLLSLGTIAKNLTKFPFLKVMDSEIAHSISVTASIRRKMSFFKLEQKVDSEMEAAYWYLLELIKITFLLEPLLLFSSLDVLKNKSKEIEQTFRFVGEVDTLVSIASLRYGLKEYCIPTISNEVQQLQFKDLMHPLIPDCVSNSITIEKSVLLTGSNMSGKTTFIRSIGLNYISGSTLNTCFATSAKLPLAKLYSVMRIEDDLMSSSSYFFREVDEIKNIIDKTAENGRSIILLDELFKGTNTVERIASAVAILSFLSKRNCQVFVTTHDMELTTLLKQEYALFHFSELIKDTTISFDYKLKTGTPERGNAIRILEINGFPMEIVRHAQALVCEMGEGNDK